MDHMPPRINLPAVLPTEAEPASPRVPLVPERSDFLEGDAPAAAKVEAFLARALEAVGGDAAITTGALVPWICDALLVEPLGQGLRPRPHGLRAAHAGAGSRPAPRDGRPRENATSERSWKRA